jgi:hypothetical protein
LTDWPSKPCAIFKKIDQDYFSYFFRYLGNPSSGRPLCERESFLVGEIKFHLMVFYFLHCLWEFVIVWSLENTALRGWGSLFMTEKGLRKTGWGRCKVIINSSVRSTVTEIPA